LLAAEQLGARRLLANFAVRGDVESQPHQPFAQVLNCLGASANRLGDPGIGPFRTVHIRLKQD
jgi:hypothetical protein